MNGRVICQLCRKRLHRQRNGAWYHDHNASVSCHPGDGTGRQAIPLCLPGRAATAGGLAGETARARRARAEAS